MKYITPFILLVCSLFAKSINAQTVVTIPATAPASCDGIAYIDNSQSFSSWYWTDNSGNTIQNGLDTLYNLCEGTYILNYTNFLGPGADTFDIAINPCGSFLVGVLTQATTGNLCNGSLSAEFTNGMAPYQCQYAPIGNQANPVTVISANDNMTIIDLCAGTYVFNVTDANGCQNTSYFMVANTCSGFEATMSGTNITQNGTCDGTLTFTGANGQAPYSFLWNTAETTQAINNLCTGDYWVLIQDANGCVDTLSQYIYSPCNFMTSGPSITHNTGLNNCNGSASITTNGGTSPFSYTWSNGANGVFANNLCTGNYTVIVEDATGCTNSVNVHVLDSSVNNCYFQLTLQPTSLINGDTCVGSIAIASTSNGVAPFVYAWSNGASSPAISNLCSGWYGLTVLDANGCIGVDTTFIADSSEMSPCIGFGATFSLASTSDSVTCDGIAVANIYGEYLPFNVLWSNGQTDPQIENLCYGNYSVTISDAIGCTVIYDVNIGVSDTNTQALSAELIIYDETFSGACDGAASVIVSGGVPPYIFSHSNGVQASVSAYMCSGIYDVTITDLTGSSIVIPYIIADPGNVIFNLPYPDSTIVDSLFGNTAIENCDIDYNTVTAAYIYNASLAGFDQVTVTWAIYDSSGVNYITDTYYFGGGNGVYSLALNVYCPQKSIDQYLKVYDQLYLSEELGIAESTLNNLIIFPNPFSESVSIQFEKTGDYEIELLDLTGRSILSHKVTAQNTFILNGLNILAKGEYLLRINTNSESVIRKIVK